MSYSYQKKSDNDVPEAGIVEEVRKEIKNLGDNTKKNYETLRNEYEEFKKIVDRADGKVDGVIKTELEKFKASITTRQDELDKKNAENLDKKNKEMNERLDELEAAFKRRMKSSGGSGDVEKKEAMAKQFLIHRLCNQEKNNKGAKFNRVQNEEIDMKEFDEYCSAFEGYIRSASDHVLSPENHKYLSVGVDPDGGYTVIPQMSNRIIERMFERSPIRQLATVESVTSIALEYAVDYDEASYGWEDEVIAGAETDTPTFNKKRIPVHVMYAKPRASQTLIEDSGINIENWLADKVADRFLRAEGSAFVSGNGVGQPRGFLTYDPYVAVGADSYGKIEQVSIGSAATIRADGLIELKYSLIEDFLNRGTWLMNRLTVSEVLQLKDANNQYLWSPGLRDDDASRLLALPVRMATDMPQIATNSLSIALADWREAYAVVDRLGISVQRDPYTQKPLVEFYTRKRVGGDVTNFQAIKIGKIA